MIAADQMPAAELPRPRTLLVGTVFAIVACGMFFAGAFGIYIKARHDVVTSAGTWLKAGQISLVPGGMMMVTTAMSVVTMTWAVQAIRNDDRKNAYIALGEADRSRAGEAADGLERSARAALGANDRSDAARGLAGLHAVAPTRPLGRYARLAAQYTSRQSDGIQAASYFWYATMLMYTLIYYGIYITK